MQHAHYFDEISASYRVDITPSLNHEDLEEVSCYHGHDLGVIPLTTTVIRPRSTHAFNLSSNSSAPETVLATPIQNPSFHFKSIS